ncbi:MAG: hypothetical protein BVN35_10855 [Proteobacteria bacterium ST_bin11]|nr:MAG: hypothetical protein BVN35_10855 [Proteobacteria bacterium ST_bin11]
MQNLSKYLPAYIDRNYKKVEGWLGEDTVLQITRINSVQTKLGISGNVGEIGVHHGKLFILLYLLMQNEEQAIAIDIFEQQNLNIDKSGRGDLSIFERNLETYAGGKSKLKTINADSTTIGAKEILSELGGKLRLFSIDGGHLPNIVRHDLNTAASAICDGGVVILDDYFNPEFPGVSEGVNQFFLLDNKELVPFFVGINKIYLTTSKYAEHYMDFFTQADLGIPYCETKKFRTYDTHLSPIRISEMFGSTVLSYSPDKFGIVHRLFRAIKRNRTQLRKQLSNSSTWEYLKSTKLGNFIRSIANKLAPY